MDLPCRSQRGRNAVATRLSLIWAKSLILKQRGSRYAVATWRNAAAGKSLKTQHRGRNAAGPFLKKGREARLTPPSSFLPF